ALGHWYIWPRALALMEVLLVIVVLHHNTRAGAVRTVGGIVVTLYFLVGIFLFWRWGMDLAQGFLVMSFTILMSSILIGTRASFIVTALVSVALLGLTYVERAHLSHP